MSGPIVRKYGFPNFEKIFGPKPLLHGHDEKPEADPAAKESTPPAAGAQTGEAPASEPAPASPAQPA